jgi:hypothetical protein
MERPAFGDVDYIALKWKEEVLEQLLFDLSYQRFMTIWYQVRQLAGFRVTPLLYTLRVGAAARLDKDRKSASPPYMGHIGLSTCYIFSSLL